MTVLTLAEAALDQGALILGLSMGAGGGYVLARDKDRLGIVLVLFGAALVLVQYAATGGL